MIGKKGMMYTINGIYGEVTNSEVTMDVGSGDTYYKSRHGYKEQDIQTGEIIQISKETPDLPLSITMDEYFKIALIQSIQNVTKSTSDVAKAIGDELKRLNDNIEKLSTPQTIHIDSLNFPNATDLDSIKEAITKLPSISRQI